MNNFSDMLSKAKAIRKMKEAQDQIKKLAEGQSGGNLTVICSD